MGTLSTRPAAPADLPACLAMFAELNRLQAPWRVFPPRAGIQEEMERRFRAALGDPDAVLVVAVDGEEVIGMAAGHVHRPSSVSDQDAVELTSVYVLPSHRRRGVTRALAGRVAEFARDRGVDRLTLRTFAGNEEALAAWRSLGFDPRMVQMTAPVARLAPHGDPDRPSLR